MAKNRKLPKKIGGTTAKKQQRPRKNDLDAIADPELRLWAKEVDRRRQELADPKRQPFVYAKIEENGQKRTVFRRKTTPAPIGSVIKKLNRKSGAAKIQEDINLARKSWAHAVGDDIVAETQIYSLVKGVLTVEVTSSALLQEIRQFHRQAIFEDLSDIWQASQPLLTIKYRLGKK